MLLITASLNLLAISPRFRRPRNILTASLAACLVVTGLATAGTGVWSTQQLVSEKDDLPDTNPIIEFDHQGMAWVIWQGRAAEGQRPILFWTRWNGGQWIGDHPVRSDTLIFRYQFAFTDSDTAWLIWHQGDGEGGRNIYSLPGVMGDWADPEMLHLQNTRLDFAPMVAYGGASFG